jgi:DNA-binding protein YbaB
MRGSASTDVTHNQGGKRMGEEGNRLADLLNVSVPDNPGKPRPWTPPAAPDAAAEAGQELMAVGEEPADESATEGAAGIRSTPQREPRTDLPAWDPDAMAAALEQTIATAEEQLAQIRQTLTDSERRTYTGEAAGEAVRVVVDGRSRVVELHVGARIVREGAGPLGKAIAEAANAAVRAAQDGTNQTLLAGLAPDLRASMEEGLAAAERERAADDGTERR